MDSRLADIKAFRATRDFLDTFGELMMGGNQLEAMLMFRSAYAYTLASIQPESRIFFMENLLKVYKSIGKEIFEDALDIQEKLEATYENCCDE